MEVIANAKLTNVDDNTISTVSELWKDRPCVVVAFRRPGCLLCREEARKVWALRDQIEAYNVRLVGLVHERIDNDKEVKDFHPAYWPGTLYHDQDKVFYKVLGDGKPAKGNIISLMNPFSAAWGNVRRAKKAGVSGNMRGDGLTMGGLLVIGKFGKDIKYMHAEKTFGDHANLDEVMKAVMEVSPEA